MGEKRKEQSSTEGKERTTIYLSPDLRTRLGYHMVDSRETMTEIIHKALTEYLDKNERRRK